MKFLKRLFGPPETIITYAPNVAPQPPAEPKPKAPAPPPPPPPKGPPEPDDEDITLIDPVAKDVWSIGKPEMQQNVPWPKRRPRPPNPEPEK